MKQNGDLLNVTAEEMQQRRGGCNIPETRCEMRNIQKNAESCKNSKPLGMQKNEVKIVQSSESLKKKFKKKCEKRENKKCKNGKNAFTFFCRGQATKNEKQKILLSKKISVHALNALTLSCVVGRI